MSVHVPAVFSEALPTRAKLDVVDDVLPRKPRLESSASSTVTVACPEQTAYTAKETQGDISHQIISSYFIGPQAENLPYFEQNIHTILEELRLARTKYFPEDGKFINEEVQRTPAFKKSMSKLSRAVQKAANLLGRTSIPFWSPRYEAHMCTDMSMASLLGYFMTMLYNPNNVALEASPLSTVAEIEVGEQLCELFGYNIDENDVDTPTGWGHVTCDGTIANLESMWVGASRNLKFYPLSLREAMEEGQPLAFLNDRFTVETCTGTRKSFSQLNHWELLNLKPNDILDIPDRLYEEHARGVGISNEFLSEVLKKHTIQSTGKDCLERIYMEKPAQYMVATTRHYSWPKGAAIAGIGSDNVIGIPVDNGARIDINALEKRLEDNLKAKQPIFAVVAIVGSTEEGAVDSLSSILALRKQYQAKGLSFLVHADAAWGGYFCSMLPKDYHPGDVINLPTEMGPSDGFVPDASLRAETQEDLFAMRFADSITVDPHKAGYIPYPAGGLCYRDGRMRFLVTWTSPYLSRGSVTSIGIYGVEGSKPGASAMSAWLSNKTIGLTQQGYGTLLAEVTWTCTRLSAEWAALTCSAAKAGPKSPFICVPFNELPSELDPHSTPEKVEAEKERIRSTILKKTNAEIIQEDATRPDDAKAMILLRELGSDLNINAFSLNFTDKNGILNKDVEEANYLMQRVIEALSVDSPTDDPTKIPLYLTSTEFSDELYGDCKKHFMKRLGLDDSSQNLMVLRNVVMSPFPTDGNFISRLAHIFSHTVAKETQIVRKRNEIGEEFHSFLIQGIDNIYLVHLPMFHVANHRQQLIISADFDNVDQKSRDKYVAMRRTNPTEPMILVTQRKTWLQKIVEKNGTFLGQIMTRESGIILKNIKVTVTGTVVSRPLNSKWRLKDYPADFMPFYLYGNDKEVNLDHVISRAPNTQLSASRCHLELDNGVQVPWEKPLVLLLNNFHEAPMQPFPSNNEIVSKHGAVIPHHEDAIPSEKQPRTPTGEEKPDAPSSNGVTHSSSQVKVITSQMRGSKSSGKVGGSGFFFRPRATFQVSVYLDGNRDDDNVEYACVKKKLGAHIGSGRLTLNDTVYVDSEAMNKDPFKKVEKITEWRHEFDQIGKEFEDEWSSSVGGTTFR
ncbi:L-tyrosine decarboxylase [Paramyrothecium foliicola]|nr:L-tyrosine decarboxylase [Paramyrothecium foliicola]